MAKKQYDNESIKSLKGPDKVRLRPGVIFGSDSLEGCEHSFFEILSNSIDEAREGYGDLISVTRHRDKSITVVDNGRGIPLDWNSREERYNWELVFCEMYAGGKYDNNAGSDYEYSLGLNGLGSCATQFSSEFFDVTVYRDGFKYDLHFEKGYNVGGLKKEAVSRRRTGTTQHWKPDIEVFTDIDIPLEYFCDVLKKQAVVNSGVTFELYDEQSKQSFSYTYKDGIADYIKELVGETAFTDIQFCESNAKGRDRADKPEYKVKMQAAFCFSNSVNVIEYYHNSSFLEYGGAPDKALKAAFVAEVDKYLTAKGKYNKDESKVTFADIQDSLVFIMNSFSTVTSYENQTKKAITNKFIQDAMTRFLREKMEVFFIENTIEGEKVLDQILVNKRSRENAERARVASKKKMTEKMDLSNKVKKFVDCRSKETDERELYIVEGDSALGSVKMARDSEFQAVMPIRGKILNCMKAPLDTVFKNEIITDLLKILGCGVEVSSKNNKEIPHFDLDNLRWSKIIICTDADVDGYQIRTLCLAMFYRLAPTLIRAGKIFIAESPLFEITNKDDTYFAYTDKEKNDIVAGLTGKVTIQRSKGLGENEPDMMKLTTMDPATRKLIQVTPADIDETAETFSVLLGDDLPARKKHIEEFGHLYLDSLDVM
ncbi:MAG: DNA topoisomerase [Clostridia bacterium]|nr:DNA topoisomerase [Clostridia bacterium]